MSEDRIDVTLGPDGGKKVFKSFEQVSEWLTKERKFWSLFDSVSHQNNSRPHWIF